MQATTPVTAADLLGPVQEMLYKLEVWNGASWLDLGALDGKKYLKRFSMKLGGAGASPDPVAGTWTAEIANEDGIFHPFHPSSSYTGLFCVGRQVRISVGAKYAGIPYQWQRLIGFMDAPVFNHEAKTVALKGTDFMKRLADTDLRSPNNYWGDSIVLSTVASQAVLGSEIYAEADAMDTLAEAPNVTNWVEEDDAHFGYAGDSGGGSTYVGQLDKATAPNDHGHAYNDNIGEVTQGTLYKLTFKYKRLSPYSSARLKVELFESGTSNLWASVSNLGAAVYTEVTLWFTAPKSADVKMRLTNTGPTVDTARFRVDQFSLKPVTSYTNTRYNLPENCNGVYLAVLDGIPIWYGQEKDGWLYDEENKVFYFVDTKMVEDGVNNLVVYYYTDQSLDNVLADLLVASGYYADRAAALAAMDYEPTGITLGRIWFEAGTKALAAVKLICERAGYRFWFAYDGAPCFKPARVRDPGVHQDLAEIRNRIVIEGIQQGMYATREDRQSSRLAGEASDGDSIAAYLEKTHSIKNHLFQDQASIDAMAAVLLAGFKDPKWYTDVKTPFNPVPLELGDTIAWPVELAVAAEPGGEPVVVELTGIVRDIEIDLGQITYKCEICPPYEEEHFLLSSRHPDTEPAAAEAGAMIIALGEGEAPSGSGDPEHELLSTIHPDTEPAAPVAGHVIMASGDPALWRKLPKGEAGEILTMVDGLPAWAPPGAPHAETHQVLGSDEIIVTGLLGELADPQPPKTHASSHLSGGSDALKLDDLAAPDDTTDLDVSTTKHGLAPKAPNDIAKFLRGDGTWAAPAGGLGYTLKVGPCNAFSPNNGATYYFGSYVVAPITASEYYMVINIPKAGTIKAAVVEWYTAGTLGSTETVSFYIRKRSGPVESLIGQETMEAVWSRVMNTALDIPVTAGSTVVFKMVCPTWVTKPTNVYLAGTIYIE